MNKSLEDIIIEYRLHEQLKATENNQEEVDDEDNNDDANFQRILSQIGVSLHKKYREKSSDDPSKNKLSDMIQQLYQTLKKTQPGLFTRTKTNTPVDDPSESTTDQPTIEPFEDDEEENEEEINPLTPEMERAHGLFDQANKLINVTFNRQYDK